MRCALMGQPVTGIAAALRAATLPGDARPPAPGARVSPHPTWRTWTGCGSWSGTRPPWAPTTTTGTEAAQPARAHSVMALHEALRGFDAKGPHTCAWCEIRPSRRGSVGVWGLWGCLPTVRLHGLQRRAFRGPASEQPVSPLPLPDLEPAPPFALPLYTLREPPWKATTGKSCP